MTTPHPARAVLGSPRALAAWALVGYAALHLVFSFFEWLLPDGRGGSGFLARSADAGFANLFVMAMPVVAVLLAVYVSPPLDGARLLTSVALVEYAVAVLFGVLAWLLGLGNLFEGWVDSPNDAFSALRYVVMGFAALLLLAVAGWLTYRAFVQLGGRLPVTVTRNPAAPPPPPPPAA